MDLKAQAEFGPDRLTVTVEYDPIMLTLIFANAIKADQPPPTEGKGRTLYAALAHLVGIPDTEAVEHANGYYPDDKVTVEEFREWLPKVLSKFFGNTSQRKEEGWR